MLILASSSPTRAKILKSKNIDFIQKSVDFDEDKIVSVDVKELVYKITKGKFDKFYSSHDNKTPFIVADTIVCVGNNILKKANSAHEAKEMINLQSGNFVKIITCMIYKSEKLELLDISQTIYEFLEFKEDDVVDYLSSNEWRGKAGACMVEGFFKPYIKSVFGLPSTAMGLGIEKLIPFLDLNHD